MPIMIPFRVLTTVVGLVMGYTAGVYIEILYNIRDDHTRVVESFLSGLSHSMRQSEDIDSEPEYLDISAFCGDCCESITATEESDEDKSQ